MVHITMLTSIDAGMLTENNTYEISHIQRGGCTEAIEHPETATALSHHPVWRM